MTARESRTSLAMIWAAWIVAAAMFAGAVACNKGRSAAGPSPAVGALAKAMLGPLGIIKTESRAAVKKAPAVAPHTDAIDAAASDLTTVQAQLVAAQTTIIANDRACKELQGKVDALEKDKAALQGDLDKAVAAKNSTATYFLAGLIALGVVGVPISLFLVRMPSLAITCGAVAGCAIVAQVMIETVREYRVEIGLGLVVLLAAGIVWAFIVKARTEKDLTASGEKYKRLLPEVLKEQANAEVAKLQSAYTRKVVPKLRKHLGLTAPSP